MTVESDLYPFPPSPESVTPQYQRLEDTMQWLVKHGLSEVIIRGAGRVMHRGPKIAAYTHYTEWADIILMGHAEMQTSGLPLRFPYKSGYVGKQFKLGSKTVDIAGVFTDLGGFPIDQESLDSQALTHGAELLLAGHQLAVAGQGESVPSYEERPRIKRGVGLMAILGGAPIQPVAIVGNTRRVPFYGRTLLEDSPLPTAKVPRLSLTKNFIVRYGEMVQLPERADEFTIDKLERKPDPETGAEILQIPDELRNMFIRFARVWGPAFYENYDRAIDDYEAAYGRAA